MTQVILAQAEYARLQLRVWVALVDEEDRVSSFLLGDGGVQNQERVSLVWGGRSLDLSLGHLFSIGV